MCCTAPMRVSVADGRPVQGADWRIDVMLARTPTPERISAQFPDVEGSCVCPNACKFQEKVHPRCDKPCSCMQRPCMPLVPAAWWHPLGAAQTDALVVFAIMQIY